MEIVRVRNHMKRSYLQKKIESLNAREVGGGSKTLNLGK